MGKRPVWRINHAVTSHHDDDLAVAVHMLDLHLKCAVTNPSDTQQLEKLRLFEYPLQG